MTIFIGHRLRREAFRRLSWASGLLALFLAIGASAPAAEPASVAPTESPSRFGFAATPT